MPRSSGGRPSRSSVLAVAAVALVVVVTGRGLLDGYVALRDRAMISMRARDVLTEHHPLVGMASSGSTADLAFNHLGPLLFDVLALPVRLFGDNAGAAVGAALINAVALWGLIRAARRIGDERAALFVAAGVVMLMWIMGAETLYDAWNPNVLVLPFTWFVLCAWLVACGHMRELPLAVGIASFCMQTHLGFPIIVTAILLAALAFGLVRPIDRRDDGGRSVFVACAVGVLAWAQPVWEQFTSDGRGNISRLLDAGSDAGEAGSPSLAARIFADVFSPSRWVSPRFEQDWSYLDEGSMPGPLLAGVIVAVVLGIGVGLAIAVAPRAPILGRLWLLLAVGVAAGVVTVMRLPLQFGAGLPAYYVRWIWPLVVLYLIAAALSVAALVPRPLLGRSRALPPIGVVAVVLVLIATAVDVRQPETRARYEDAVRSVRDQVGDSAQQLAGTRVVVRFDTLAWYLPYPYETSAALEQHGVDVVVVEEFMVRQYGPDRRARADDAATVYATVGAAPPPERDGVRHLARVRRTPDGEVTIVYDPNGR